MVTKIEKFYGFKVVIEQTLEPTKEPNLKLIAAKLAEQKGLDLRRFFVYCHHVQFVLTKRFPFGFDGDIPDRISALSLTFNVNQKQQEFGDIEFHYVQNPTLEADQPPGIRLKPTNTLHEVGFQIPSDYFRNYLYVRSAIFTFIKEGIVERHRKIKANIRVFPSAEYGPKITSDSKSKHTKLDLLLHRAVQLKFDFDDDHPRPFPPSPAPMPPPPPAPPPAPMLVSAAPATPGQTVIHIHGNVHAGVLGTSTGQTSVSFMNTDAHKALAAFLQAIQAERAEHADDVAAVDEAVKSETRSGAIAALAKGSKWLLHKANDASIPLALEMVKEALKIKFG